MVRNAYSCGWSLPSSLLVLGTCFACTCHKYGYMASRVQPCELHFFDLLRSCHLIIYARVHVISCTPTFRLVAERSFDSMRLLTICHNCRHPFLKLCDVTK